MSDAKFDTIVVEQVSLSQAKFFIKRAIRKQRPVFLWGGPGIGKSDIIFQIGRELKRPVIDFRLLLMDVTDLKGIPYYNPVLDRMVWAPPSELPLDEDSDAILFLDELNSAREEVQATAYQLTLNRRVGEHILGKNVAIVAAGNRLNDQAVVYNMPSALANRFMHFEMIPTYEDFKTYAMEQGFNPILLSYLEFSKGSLYRFSAETASRAWPSPRTWFALDDMLKLDEGEEQLTPIQLTKTCASCVGEAEAVRLAGWFENLSAGLPTIQSILDGSETKLSSDITVNIRHALIMILCHELRELYALCAEKNKLARWYSMANNFLEFVMGNYHDDLQIVTMRYAMKNYELDLDPMNCPAWIKFSTRHAETLKEIRT